ncbi:PREDICTED: complement receptor type 1-like, partial [Myotis brandtii]|uniref:complement receptor type 1-like n=1 Tax=Myotis brandtii TaxID=109478 RepID=UPI0007040648
MLIDQLNDLLDDHLNNLLDDAGGDFVLMIGLTDLNIWLLKGEITRNEEEITGILLSQREKAYTLEKRDMTTMAAHVFVCFSVTRKINLNIWLLKGEITRNEEEITGILLSQREKAYTLEKRDMTTMAAHVFVCFSVTRKINKESEKYKHEAQITIQSWSWDWNPGSYYLLGTKNLYCEVSRKNVEWSDSPPQCERILCQPPQQIPNGEFSNSHKDTFEYSEVVTYSCKPSNGPDEYSLVGESRLVCSGRNQWSSNPPECKGRGGCDDLPTFASMELKGNPAPHYAPGNTVEYECLPGYKRLIPVLPTSAVCQPDNTWTPLQEACTRKSCPQLVEPQNAQVFFTHGTFQFGSQAHYVCNEGYNLIGVDILYCNVSGNNVEWSDSPPQCESKYILSLEFKEVVRKFFWPGDPFMQEQASGYKIWGSDSPQCKLVKCNYPVLEHGRLVSGHEKQYHYKAKVVFECLEGFDLQGSSTVFCGSNNNWEPKMPKCIKGDFPEVELQSLENVNPINPATPPVTSFLEHSTQTSKPPSKGNKEYDACGDPPKYQSMKPEGNPAPPYNAGFTIEYECRPGYRLIVPLVRPTSAVCQLDNTWAPPLREACTMVKCEYPILENGRLVSGFGKTFLFKAEIKFECLKGFYLEGSSTIVCGADSTWGPKIPKCIKGGSTPSDKPPSSADDL